MPAASVRPAQSHLCPGSAVGSLCGRTSGLEAVWTPGGRSSSIKRFGLTLLLLLRSCVVRLFTLIFGCSLLHFHTLVFESVKKYRFAQSVRCSTCRVSPWFSVCENDDLFVLRFKGAHEVKPCLLIWLGTAEAEDEQMAMGVCAGESLAIRGEFAVENRSMTLALNLDEKHKITPFSKTS